MTAPMTPRIIAGLVVALLAVAGPVVAVAADAALADPQTGCRVVDPWPEPGKTVRWSGPCRNGVADGEGVLQWAVDGRYAGWLRGTLKEGRPEGRVRVEWADGRVLDGSFRNGRADGPGTFAWPDGRRYIGEWADGRRDGPGTLAYPDGRRYIGWFKDGRPTEQGELVAADGGRHAALIDGKGEVVAGAPLAAQPAGSEVRPTAAPGSGSLEEWLRTAR